MLILVNADNCHEDEITELKSHLDNESWRNNFITENERQGMLQIINYVISERVNDKATDLCYIGLLGLKNKLQ